MSYRGSFEFSDSVKDSARNEWHAKNPGHQLEEKLEVDHVIAIWFAKRHHIPPELISSRSNAQALRPEEHKQKHRDENEKEYFYLAYVLLGWIRGLLN